MPRYRAYQVDHEARVMGFPLVLDCADDEAAIERAKLGLDGGSYIEVWHGSRLVSRFQPRSKANGSSNP
jgi:hypothetical protein